MEGFYRTYYELIETIDYAIEKKRIIPALILLYSAIDSFSQLSEVTENKGRSVFKGWVKKWMLEKYPLPCNEIDIYSARCGLLHQHISESDLTHQKKAKEIYYTWGNAKVELLQNTISNSKINKQAIAVKIEDLIFSFRNGFADCINEINKNPNWKDKFEKKSQQFFVSISPVV